MDNKSKARIVIPNVNDYRAGIPVLRASTPAYQIAVPNYNNSVMAGRVLHPITRGDRR